MTPDEARILTERATGNDHDSTTRIRGNLRKAFGRPFVLVVALIYFFNQITNVGIVFNIPAIVEDLDISGSFLIGLLSGSAGIGATIGVLVVPRLFARYPREALAVGILAAATLVTSIAFMLSSSALARILLIAVSMVFVFGTLPLFWSIAMARMSGLMAAASLAFINTIGLIGGFVGPYLFGLAETATNNPSAGFYVVIIASVIGVALAPILAHTIRREDAAA